MSGRNPPGLSVPKFAETEMIIKAVPSYRTPSFALFHTILNAIGLKAVFYTPSERYYSFIRYPKVYCIDLVSFSPRSKYLMDSFDGFLICQYKFSFARLTAHPLNDRLHYPTSQGLFGKSVAMMESDRPIKIIQISISVPTINIGG